MFYQLEHFGTEQMGTLRLMKAKWWVFKDDSSLMINIGGYIEQFYKTGTSHKVKCHSGISCLKTLGDRAFLSGI